MKPYYWDAKDFTLGGHRYLADDDDNYCAFYDDHNDPTCGDYCWTSLVDAVIVTKVEGVTGSSSTCTFGVDKSAGTSCPLLYAPLARTPAGSEQYWP